MHWIDWTVLCGTLASIVLYGIWKTRKSDSVGFLKGKDTPWWAVGLSIMATQASAITFLSTPGQAYEDGMGFVQFYFGLPIAMVLLCVFVLPIYFKLRVFTAYEYLESRFDGKTRVLTASLFLIQRALAAGMTIFAPAIILSSIMGWNLTLTNIVIGSLVIIYTIMGGTDAVTQTQKQQMFVIFTGIFIAFFILIAKFPAQVSFSDALHLGGKMDKLNILDFSFDLSNRYTFWTGMLASVFLFLSYFGTDQSQVQRYLGGRSLGESRLGLLFNGLVKIPMQFFILLIGVMVFIFYQFNETPIHYNQANLEIAKSSQYAAEIEGLEKELEITFIEKKEIAFDLSAEVNNSSIDVKALELRLNQLINDENNIRSQAKEIISMADKGLDTDDGDYVFIHFILNYLPIGLIGLLLAVIFSAAMSSTASEINALATTTCVDVYKRCINNGGTDAHYLLAGKIFTLMWGALALGFALVANLFDNLIEAVNIIGSLFYGTILGIFVVAFFIKKIKSNAVFIAAIISELLIIGIYFVDKYEISLPIIGQIELAYLWLNMLGCIFVMFFSGLIQLFLKE